PAATTPQAKRPSSSSTAGIWAGLSTGRSRLCGEKRQRERQRVARMKRKRERKWWRGSFGIPVLFKLSERNSASTNSPALPDQPKTHSYQSRKREISGNDLRLERLEKVP